jgi:hypothetical protein
MRSSIFITALLGTASAQLQYTSTGSSAVAAARATALTESPTSNVVGKTFDRFVVIFCENTDYSMAAGDRKLQFPPLNRG